MEHRPLDDEDRQAIDSALAVLHSHAYFGRKLEQATDLLMNQFESTAPAERLMLVERLSALRMNLLAMAQESADAAARVNDSTNYQENQNEVDVDAE
jgi:hypothetical protein